MRHASIRTVQHQLAAMIAVIEKGGEIIITRHRRPVARLSPILPDAGTAGSSPAAIRRYWRLRQVPAAVRSSVTHAELVAAGRGDV
jgi:antitoxin (DNA-binding transcriptional repressor) of toxin-antitoxin stability system